MNEPGHPRLEHLPVRRAHAGRAHRLQREPVVRLVARDDLDLVGPAARLPVEPRGLEGGFVGFGAARRQEDRLHRVAADFQQSFGQLDGANIRGAGEPRTIGQLAHLRRGGLSELRAAMADVHVPEPGQRVDVLVPVNVLHHDAAAACVDHGVFAVARIVQRMDQILPIVSGQLLSLAQAESMGRCRWIHHGAYRCTERASLTTSDKTLPAVTSAPAPGPCRMRGVRE